jgi:hypothetical protein
MGLGQCSSLPGKLGLDPKACPMSERPDGLMGPMAILGISDKGETNKRNISEIACGNDCVEYKLSSCVPQLPRWRPKSLRHPQTAKLAHDPTNSSSTRMPR